MPALNSIPIDKLARLIGTPTGPCIIDDDLQQLEAGMLIYDAFYKWCRDATDEAHNWTSHKPAKGATTSASGIRG